MITVSFIGFAVATFALFLYLQKILLPGQTIASALLLMTLAQLIIAERILTANVLSPLAKLRAASAQILKGNLKLQMPRMKHFQHNSELAPMVAAFEALVKRACDLDSLLAEAKKEGEQIKAKSNYYISEKERELEQKNAMLVGNAREFENTVQELSARNRELIQAYDKLEKLDKTKTDFLLIAAHELRTPIQPILGFAKLAEKGLMDKEAAWKLIETEAKKLADMASDILDAGRIESGSFSYKMKPTSMKQILESATSGSPKLFNTSGAVAIVKDFDSDCKLMGDQTRLSQAFLNIVSNAVKFAGTMPITLRTRNDVERGAVEVKVIDSGAGIDPDVLPILFNKFVTKTEANQRGAGLGLYIARSIIESHGGKISAENNKEGAGATFTVVLPLLKETPDGNNMSGMERKTSFEVPN